MLKDIVVIKHRLITKDKSAFVMSLLNFIASSYEEREHSFRELYELLITSLDEQSTVEIIDDTEHKVFNTTQLHNNLSRYHHLLMSIDMSNTIDGSDSIFMLELRYYTGNLGIVINTSKMEAQIEFPEWMGYIETPEALYLPNGIIPVSSGLFKTFKYKQKFHGLRCKA